MAKVNFTKEDIIGIEPVFVNYAAHRDGKPHDACIVKERLHLRNTDYKPTRLRLIENYQRPFWITKEGCRTHKQKKQSEFVRNVDKYRSTDVNIRRAICDLLRAPGLHPNLPLRQIARNPYVYGLDLPSTTFVKQSYFNKYKDLPRALNSVAIVDIENDVYNSDPELRDRIILLSITMKERGYTLVLNDWIKDVPDFEASVRKILKEKLEDEVTEKFAEWDGDLNHPKADVVAKGLLARRDNFNLVVEYYDDPGQMVARGFEILHKELRPDILGAWNFQHEYSNFIRDLVKSGFDPVDIFNDPNIPPEYRRLWFHEGLPYKISDSGVKQKKAYFDIWHWLHHNASFQFVCQQRIYRTFRKSQKTPSYALDNILDRECKLRKFKVAGTEKYKALAWHHHMQTHADMKAYYTVYNIFDCIFPEILDEKTSDLSSRISTTVGAGHFELLNSDPKRLVTSLAMWYLDLPENERQVIGSTSDNLYTEIDEKVVTPSEYIVTLPSYLITPCGVRAVKDVPDMQTLVFAHCADLDVTATYPTVSRILGIDPMTVAMEFCMIRGVTEERRKALGVDLTGGRGNAVAIATEYLKAPKLDELLADFLEEIA